MLSHSSELKTVATLDCYMQYKNGTCEKDQEVHKECQATICDFAKDKKNCAERSKEVTRIIRYQYNYFMKEHFLTSFQCSRISSFRLRHIPEYQVYNGLRFRFAFVTSACITSLHVVSSVKHEVSFA